MMVFISVLLSSVLNKTIYLQESIQIKVMLKFLSR